LFKKRKTTISFEGNEIRTVTIRGKNIIGWQTRSLPPDQMNRGLIHDPQAVSAEIRAALKELKGSRKNVISSVSGSRSVHRIMKIPIIPEKLLKETIERKARQEFAIPIEDMDLSWKIITKRDNHMILYALAVPKVMIDNQVQALKGAGIRTRVLDIKPLALSRITDRETSLIVNLEDHSMSVIILVNNVPMLIRNIPLDSGDLTGEAKTDLLGQELARTTKYYNESHKQSRLPDDTPVYVTGSLFSSGNVDSRLEKSPALVERLSIRTPYPMKPPVTKFNLPKNFPLLGYATNLGLAVKN